MKVEIEIPNHELLELAKGIMQNYPEYSFCLQCIGWKYEKGVYLFEDEEEDEEGKPKRYTVTVEEIAARGLPLFIKGHLEGKYHFCGFEGGLPALRDGCSYDCPSVDAVVQLTIFGDIIYG